MAELKINFKSGIKAVILVNSDTIPSYYPLIIDPVSDSYSSFGGIVEYYLYVTDVIGLERIGLLQNGKNSRFTAGGSGSCKLTLRIEDEKGNTDEDSVIINVG